MLFFGLPRVWSPFKLPQSQGSGQATISVPFRSSSLETSRKSVSTSPGQGPAKCYFGLSRVRSPLKLPQSLGSGQPGHYFRAFPSRPARLGSPRLEASGWAAGKGPAGCRRRLPSGSPELRSAVDRSAQPGRVATPPPLLRRCPMPPPPAATPSHPAGGGIYGLALNPKRVNLGWYAAGSCAGWEDKISGASGSATASQVH